MSSVDATNDFLYGARGKVLVPTVIPICRTKQQAYRTAVWLKNLAEILPDEEVPSTFEEIDEAVRNA